MHKFKEQLGQGILETTIAIGVIVTALVGTVSLVSFTLRSSVSTLNRLIAQNLSWEGIEVAVNLRDSNFLAGDLFDTGFGGGSDTTAIAVFDESVNIWFLEFAPTNFADDASILYREGGLYRQDIVPPTGVRTNFRRILTIELVDPDILDITSTVQWSERGDSFVVESTRSLYNWK